MSNNARHAAIKSLKEKPLLAGWLILCVIGLLVAVFYKVADLISWNLPYACLLNFIGFGLAAIGLIQLIVVLDSKNLIDWRYLRDIFEIFVVVGVAYYGIGLFRKDQDYEWAGIFCLLQAVIYFSSWKILKNKDLKSSLRKLLIYPIVLLVAVAISTLPGYETLYEKVSGGFLGLLLFTQTKDVWEIYVKTRSVNNEPDASIVSAGVLVAEDNHAQ